MKKSLNQFSLYELLGIPASQKKLFQRFIAEKLKKRIVNFDKLEEDFSLTGLALRDKKRLVLEILHENLKKASTEKLFYRQAIFYAKNDQWEELVEHWERG